MVTPDESRARRLVKVLKILVRITVGLLLVAGLITVFREQLPWTFDEAGAGERAGRVALTTATLVLSATALMLWLRWPRPVWRTALCLLAATVCGWSWLAWDDPVLEYPPENYLTVFDDPAAQASHDLVLRYRTGAGSTLPKDLPVLREPRSSSSDVQPTAEQWTVFVTDNRADIERGWEMLADRRAWMAEMAGAPRLADLTAGIGDPIPSFRDLREASRFMSWHARMLAMDGRGDEALAEIGQILEVGQKLEPESRTLVRGMIAIVLRKMALLTAASVLETTEVSPDSRARFAGILAQRQPAVDGAYHLIWCEYAVGAKVTMAMESHSSPGAGIKAGLNNPRSTANLYAKILMDAAGKSSRRELNHISEMAPPWSDAAHGFKLKNLAGRLLLQMVVPAFQKVSAEYWKAEDLSVALSQRLGAGTEDGQASGL